MSVLRVCFSGKGVDKAVSIRQENDYAHIAVGSSDIPAKNVTVKEDMLLFDVGHSFGCSDEFDDFMYDLAESMPDNEINYYWHSTMSNMSDSYNFGFIDGEFVTWEDDEVYPECGYCVKYEGIDRLISCGEKDSAGFTCVRVNEKEFWLNNMILENNCIRFNNAEKSTRSYRGFAEEIAKNVSENEIMIEIDDFASGATGISVAVYKNGEYSEKFLGWQE